MRTSGNAKVMLCASKPRAKSLVNSGVKSITSKLSPSINALNFNKTSAKNSPFLLLFIKCGKKACVNAPSPKSRLKRLGNLKATKNISLQSPAPRLAAVSRSRKNPKMREIKIPAELVKKCLSISPQKFLLIIARLEAFWQVKIYEILKFACLEVFRNFKNKAKIKGYFTKIAKFLCLYKIGKREIK